MIQRIRVDTNNLIRDGLILAYIGRAKNMGFLTEELHVGDTVHAHDIAEQGDFTAVIRDMDTNRVFLELDWDSFTPWGVITGEEGDFYDDYDNDDE